MKRIIKIEGMSCGHCTAAVTRALNAVDGVIAAAVDLESKAAAVEVGGTVTDDMLKAAVEDAGYEVTGIE